MLSNEKAHAIFKAHAKTFYFAAKCLAKQNFSEAAQLYATLRYLDDLVDEKIADEEVTDENIADEEVTDEDKLNGEVIDESKTNEEIINEDKLTEDKLTEEVIDDTRWSAVAHQKISALIAAIEKNAPLPPEIQSTLANFKKQNLSTQYFLDFLAGMRSDCQERVVIQTEEALIQYCYRVAGAVGAMMCPILGIAYSQREQALPYAIALGIGMQLTNIARDIQEDAGNQRIYIPAEWKTVSDPHILLSSPVDQASDFTAECKRLLDLADDYYALAMQGLPFLPFQSRVSILLALTLYQAIGKKIQRVAYAYWQGRQSLSGLEKIKKSLVVIGSIAHPKFWIKPDAEALAFDKTQLANVQAC
ncbi:MAG: phytoene/squalene synthase family protein [Cyanobacteria bacterium P01_H01_bin.74]